MFRPAKSLRRREKMYIYMKVTRDDLELPVAVADSPTELAEIIGKSKRSISKIFSLIKTKGAKYKSYKIVEVEDEL